MKYVIKYTSAKAIWTDFILTHEGPSKTKDTKIAALRLKVNASKALKGEKVNGTFTRMRSLLNDLGNNGVLIPQAKVNATFVNNLSRKWLSMNQTQMANNSIKNDTLTALYSKYNYEEESDLDIEEDQRSSSEFLVDLNAKFHERDLLANQRRSYKRSRNIVRAIGRKGMRKEQNSLKEVVFIKSGVLTSKTNPKIPSNSKSEGKTQRPQPTIPKLFGAEPSCKRSVSLAKTTQTTDKV
nr:hypothetical protein [Tanacetum cinerariifolium]